MGLYHLASRLGCPDVDFMLSMMRDGALSEWVQFTQWEGRMAKRAAQTN
jgi:hypothetical protein